MTDVSEIDGDDAASIGAPPSDASLEEGLRSLLTPDLELQTRSPSPYSSTFATERVSALCETGPLELLCKYGSGRRDAMSGHRRGVDYEAIVYRSLLPDDDLTTPRCHGTFQVIGSTQCLVLDYVDGFRVSSSPYPRGLLWTCTDLARFHARGVRSTAAPLNLFDRAYFNRWADVVDAWGDGEGPVRRVLTRLRESIQLIVEILCRAPRTVVHGELYPANVLVDAFGAVVVDWESAGIGPGVMDLAVLTQGRWDRHVVDECETAYWEHIGPYDDEKATLSLAAARVFAAVQLLHHLARSETDGSTENLAVEEIETQLAELRGRRTS